MPTMKLKTFRAALLAALSLCALPSWAADAKDPRVTLIENKAATTTTGASVSLSGKPHRVIVTGMGKSGLIAQKIAATFSSTGTPAFFLHPAEAIHGDLGVIQAEDVVVALSYSGETDELLRLLETIKRLGARLVVVTRGAKGVRLVTLEPGDKLLSIARIVETDEQQAAAGTAETT
mgnify:CR=1 FL=1